MWIYQGFSGVPYLGNSCRRKMILASCSKWIASGYGLFRFRQYRTPSCLLGHLWCETLECWYLGRPTFERAFIFHNRWALRFRYLERIAYNNPMQKPCAFWNILSLSRHPWADISSWVSFWSNMGNLCCQWMGRSTPRMAMAYWCDDQRYELEWLTPCICDLNSIINFIIINQKNNNQLKII